MFTSILQIGRAPAERQDIGLRFFAEQCRHWRQLAQIELERWKSDAEGNS
jgi:hypothetical protein